MKKVSSWELSSLVIMLSLTQLFGISFTIIKSKITVDLLFAMGISGMLGFIPIMIILYISRVYPDESLARIVINIGGGKLGLIINFILEVIFSIIGITILYNINNFILSQFLYTTPIIVSTFIFMALVIYCNGKGINTITRSALILQYLNLVLYSLNVIPLLKQVDLLNFYPLLRLDNDSLLESGVIISWVNYLPLIIILLIPRNKITLPKKYNQVILISYVISLIIVGLIIFVTQGVLGVDLIRAFEYPEYIAIKRINLFNFLERIENIVCLEWIINAFIYLNLIIYMFKDVKGMKKNRLVNLIGGIVIGILSIISFKSNTEFNNYILNIYPYITGMLIPIYLFLGIGAYIRKREF